MPTTLPQRKVEATVDRESRLLAILVSAMWLNLALALIELYAFDYSSRSGDVVASRGAQDGYGVKGTWAQRPDEARVR
jgi:hypothetical protein